MTTEYQSCVKIIPPETGQSSSNRGRKFRTLAAYWVLGLCNNYGYVVMLTAAKDIIAEQTGTVNETAIHSDKRDCTYMSTGAILLADILPGLICKFIAPFIPFFVNVRVAICVILASAGYLSVAFSNSFLMSLIGVVLTSFCSGLGEVTYLQYSTFYNKNVLSTWSSGTGGAGIVGALSYSILQRLGMRTSLLIMLIVPLTMAISFWVLLPRPSVDDIAQALEIQMIVNREEMKNPIHAIRKKISLIPGLMKYIIPFFLVYLFEYFINQGMFELTNYKDAGIDAGSQYRWLQVTYQVGVFLSRSSVNLFHIKKTYIFALLQGINVIIFTTEVLYFYIPNYYWVVALVLWEGLLGGSSYVNTFYRISTEVSLKST
ncbi:unnamed protein product [Acanthoscelides obtectus]|uniref:Battenin n=1 Tax=Acanthoscelides obtectus TaxID=200917 RepID=A0A9P0K437_ACAOB|nr:unnamed protein product [Acanthoscelides obtectus]CAK1629081.1 Battenin [Acanthoscelides obtectus]